MPLHVTLPDGSPLELPDGATALDAARAIGPRLAKAAVTASVTPSATPSVTPSVTPPTASSVTSPGAADSPAQPQLVDLSHKLSEGDQVAIITLDSPQGVDVLRHDAAHVLAQAVLRLWPATEYSIGPTIENGFYYDFKFAEPISDADFARIEEEMARIVAEDLVVTRHEVSAEEALAVFGPAGAGAAGTNAGTNAASAGSAGSGPAARSASGLPAGLSQPFKVELVRDLLAAAEAAGRPAPTLTIYAQGEFVDLCRGPHLPSTGRLGKGTFKLTSLAGAYWRGDEHNAQLTRVYGTAFAKKEELAAYLEALELARQRDHRRIGRDLDLFSFHEEGPGFPFFHARGMRIWNAIIDFWRAEHVKAGYEEIRTPMILRRELWERSGHWENYKDNMYFTEIDGAPFAVKPMNCPGGLLVFKSRRRSYRDLPLRMAELGQVHRHEMSGVLHGLFRVRYFTQDDAHIYCTPEQLEDEVRGVVRFMHSIYAAFGFTDVKVELSTRPQKSIGSDEMWQRAEGTLTRVLDSELGHDGQPLVYALNPGDGAFYGPKIDFHIRDVMGRTWQCGTIQVDFAMPERLDITYTGADNEEHRPVMIHRALLGSIERFMGILLEQYGGNLPTWLAPEQALVIPVADRHAAYGAEVVAALRAAGLRAELDDRSESISKRIRDGQLQKVPYLLVVGEREAEARAVSVRERGVDHGSQPLGEVVEHIREEVELRLLPGVEPEI
ncbi:MAG: threonine--tRNA ligase [Thermoleophilia bacterium]